MRQAERRENVSIVDTAKASHVSRQAVTKWNRDPWFNYLASQIVLMGNDFNDHLVDRSVQQQAIEGRPTAIEANLRRRGLWNTDAGYAQDLPGQGAAISAGGNITFVNVPVPLTGEQARALRPAPGTVIPAPEIPPMPVRPPAPGLPR